MASTALTVKVHLDFDLNGEPITHLLETPASIEDSSLKHGLTVHLHIDAKKLAKIITPYIAREVSQRVRMQTDERTF